MFDQAAKQGGHLGADVVGAGGAGKQTNLWLKQVVTYDQ
jgi:hypothetical protein